MAASSPSGGTGVIGFIGRLQRLSAAEGAMLLEALVLLAFSSAAIRLLPFSRVGRLASLRLGRARSGCREALVGQVAWALTACARRAPWRSVCFQQGLAAQIMLRRRGVDATLFYGAAQDKTQGLSAHVWVRAGRRDVVGCDAAEGFAILATFPDRPGGVESVS